MADGRIVSNVAVKETVLLCEFLSQCPAFAALTPAELSGIAENLIREDYSADTIVFRQGDSGDRFYLIRHGSVDVIVLYTLDHAIFHQILKSSAPFKEQLLKVFFQRQ
jgi:CRP-like cAMP-binding protein